MALSTSRVSMVAAAVFISILLSCSLAIILKDSFIPCQTTVTECDIWDHDDDDDDDDDDQPNYDKGDDDDDDQPNDDKDDDDDGCSNFQCGSTDWTAWDHCPSRCIECGHCSFPGVPAVFDFTSATYLTILLAPMSMIMLKCGFYSYILDMLTCAVPETSIETRLRYADVFCTETQLRYAVVYCILAGLMSCFYTALCILTKPQLKSMDSYLSWALILVWTFPFSLVLLYYSHQPHQQLLCLRRAAHAIGLSFTFFLWTSRSFRVSGNEDDFLPFMLPPGFLAAVASFSGGWIRPRCLDMGIVVGLLGCLVITQSASRPFSGVFMLHGMSWGIYLTYILPSPLSMTLGLRIINLIALAIWVAVNVGSDSLFLVLGTLALLVLSTCEYVRWKSNQPDVAAVSGEGAECISVVSLAITCILTLLAFILPEGGASSSCKSLLSMSCIMGFACHLGLLSEIGEKMKETKKDVSQIVESCVPLVSETGTATYGDETFIALIRDAHQSLASLTSTSSTLLTSLTSFSSFAEKYGNWFGKSWRLQHKMVLMTSSYSALVCTYSLFHLSPRTVWLSVDRSLNLWMSPHSAGVCALIISAALILISGSSLLNDAGWRAAIIIDTRFTTVVTLKAFKIAFKTIANQSSDTTTPVTHWLLASSSAVAIIVSMILTMKTASKETSLKAIEDKEPRISKTQQILLMYRLQWICTKVGLTIQMIGITLNSGTGINYVTLPFDKHFGRSQEGMRSQYRLLNVIICLALALGGLITNELSKLIQPKGRHSAALSADGVRTSASFVALVAGAVWAIWQNVSQIGVARSIFDCPLTWSIDLSAMLCGGVTICCLNLLRILTKQESIVQ